MTEKEYDVFKRESDRQMAKNQQIHNNRMAIIRKVGDAVDRLDLDAIKALSAELGAYCKANPMK